MPLEESKRHKDNTEPFFTFEMDGMLKYFSRFDPIEYRYNLADTLGKRENDLDDICRGCKIASKHFLEQRRTIHSLIARYEKSRSQMENSDADSSDILKNLLLIYGDKEPIKKYIQVYEIVQRKLISGYLRIEGLANLFHQKYFEFEWEQHTGLNYKSHRQSYYRDHFLHQAKVTYEAMRFLAKMPALQDSIINAFTEDDTVIASYIRKAVTNEYSAVAGEPDAREIYGSLYDAKFDFAKEFTETTEPLAYSHIFRNIIKSSMIMAGLFHDIGYPIQYVNDNKEQLTEFIPAAHFFFDPALHLDDILGKLSDSLLRKIVPYEKLKSAFNAQLHGTLSAFAFLLYFYENGAIYSLRPAKRAAVELAALIMADHTNRFDILKDKDADYYRMTSYKNPLSFLMRFCDDIQEWGRTYFYISPHDSMRICRKCGFPIIHCEYIYDDVKMRRHLCDCMKAGRTEDKASEIYHSKLINGELYDGDVYSSIYDVPFRRLNHISVSERVRVFRVATRRDIDQKSYYLDFLPGYENDDIDNRPDIDNISGRDAYIVQVDYTLYRLLQIAFVEPEFARYRADELNKLKKLLSYNKYFPTALIYSEITTNPITLKVKILERFITNLHSRYELVLSNILERTDVQPREQDITIIESLIENLRNRCGNLDEKAENLFKLSESDAKEMLATVQIEMLLFSKKRFSISEIANTVYAAERNANKESSETGLDMEMLKRLLEFRQSKSIEEDFVGLKRDDFCAAAVAVYNRLRELFEIGNPIESKLVQVLASRHETILNFCTVEIIRECKNDENAVYAQVREVLSGSDAEFLSTVRDVVNDELLNVLTGKYCEVLLRCMPKTAKKRSQKNIYQNLILYFNLLTASKLFVLAKKVLAKEALAKEILHEKKSDDEIADRIRASIFIKYIHEIVVKHFADEDLIKSYADEYSGDRSLEILIKDFFTQESRHITYYDHALRNLPLPKEYFEIYSQPVEVEKAIQQYTDANNYKRAIYEKNRHFEAHFDLYVFSRMAHAVQ